VVKGYEIGLGSEQCIDRFAQTTLEAERTGRKLGRGVVALWQIP
jgi:hypothetical protein